MLEQVVEVTVEQLLVIEGGQPSQYCGAALDDLVEVVAVLVAQHVVEVGTVAADIFNSWQELLEGGVLPVVVYTYQLVEVVVDLLHLGQLLRQVPVHVVLQVAEDS